MALLSVGCNKLGRAAWALSILVIIAPQLASAADVTVIMDQVAGEFGLEYNTVKATYYKMCGQ